MDFDFLPSSSLIGQFSFSGRYVLAVLGRRVAFKIKSIPVQYFFKTPSIMPLKKVNALPAD